MSGPLRPEVKRRRQPFNKYNECNTNEYARFKAYDNVLSQFLNLSCLVNYDFRGLNSVGRSFNTTSLLRNLKPDVMCFQETKNRNDLRQHCLWFMGWVFHLVVFSNNFRSLWRHNFNVGYTSSGCVEEVVGTFSISNKLKCALDQFVWAFSVVYGPNAGSKRCYLWEKLTGLCIWWEVPWWIRGDFNVIHFLNERVGLLVWPLPYGYSVGWRFFRLV